MIPFAMIGGIFNIIELGGPYFIVKNLDWNPQVAYTICFFIATSVAFTLNTFFTFRSKFSLANALRYYLIYAGAWLIGITIITLLRYFTDISEEYLHFFPAPTVYIWNFFMANRFLQK